MRDVNLLIQVFKSKDFQENKGDFTVAQLCFVDSDGNDKNIFYTGLCKAEISKRVTKTLQVIPTSVFYHVLNVVYCQPSDFDTVAVSLLNSKLDLKKEYIFIENQSYGWDKLSYPLSSTDIKLQDFYFSEKKSGFPQCSFDPEKRGSSARISYEKIQALFRFQFAGDFLKAEEKQTQGVRTKSPLTIFKKSAEADRVLYCIQEDEDNVREGQRLVTPDSGISTQRPTPLKNISTPSSAMFTFKEEEENELLDFILYLRRPSSC